MSLIDSKIEGSNEYEKSQNDKINELTQENKRLLTMLELRGKRLEEFQKEAFQLYELIGNLKTDDSGNYIVSKEIQIDLENRIKELALSSWNDHFEAII